MSLDVYLKTPGVLRPKTSSGIFIRRDGSTIEISREEWDELHPGQEPATFEPGESPTDVVFHYNITHNLMPMAKEAGLFDALWLPEALMINVAKELIKPLTLGLGELVSKPQHYKQFNPKNNWGNYEGLVMFVTRYLAACQEWPEAIIEVSR